MLETIETWPGGVRKTRRQKSIGSIGIDQDYLENRKNAEGETHGAKSWNKICKELIMFILSRLIRGFRNKYYH